jgi:hypothetical protein
VWHNGNAKSRRNDMGCVHTQRTVADCWHRSIIVAPRALRLPSFVLSRFDYGKSALVSLLGFCAACSPSRMLQPGQSPAPRARHTLVHRLLRACESHSSRRHRLTYRSTPVTCSIADVPHAAAQLLHPAIEHSPSQLQIGGRSERQGRESR